MASLLIFIRILFRLAETAQGVFGYLMVHEVFFGILEFAPVISAVSILAIFHPGRWIAGGGLAEGTGRGGRASKHVFSMSVLAV